MEIMYNDESMMDLEDSKLIAESKSIQPNAIVKQSNEIVNGRWRMNINQSRIFLTAVSMVEESDNEFQRYRISGSQLKEMLNLKGNSIYEQLKRDVPKMMKTFMEIDKANKTEWISIVSSATYLKNEGDLLIKFSPEMKPFLLNVKEKFTQCKLIDAIKFKSMYSLRIFLLLKQYDKTGWRFMTVEELRTALGLNATKDNDLDSDLYPLVGDLKRRVIEPAIKELRENGFNVEYEPFKEKRKITAFRFAWHAEQVKNMPSQLKADNYDDTTKRLIERLQNIGLNDSQIKKIGYCLKNGIFTPLQLNQTIWAIENKINDNNIPNDKKGGYAYKTFSGKFFDNQSW